MTFDQAEGLRRMLFGAKPRFVTFLSALNNEEKNATLVNLSAGLMRLNHDVVLLDTRIALTRKTSVTSWLETRIGATLTDVAKQKSTLEEAMHVTSHGFKLVRLHSCTAAMETKTHFSQLNKTVEALGQYVDIVLVDGELDEIKGLPAEILEEGEIVILVTNQPDSIKAAYSQVKRAHCIFGRRSYGILVAGANALSAKRVYETIAQVAENFLSVPLSFLGFVPQDDYLHRANKSGRLVIDAFPGANASVAFSKLAQQMITMNELAPS